MIYIVQIGSGTFTVTDGYTVAEPTVTVIEVVSYCGPGAQRMGDLAVMDQIAANISSPSTAAGPNYMIDADLQNGTVGDNSTHSSNKTSLSAPYLFPNSTLTNGTLSNSTHTNETQCDEFAIAGCRQCCNSAGICCPLEVPCDANGKCPGFAIEAMGYLRGGLNMVMARNGSDGSQGIDDSVDPRDLGYIGVDADGDEMAARFGPGGTFGDGSASSEERFGDDDVDGDESPLDADGNSKRDVTTDGAVWPQRRDVTEQEMVLMQREQERKERVRKQKQLIRSLNEESARQRREGIDGSRLAQRRILAGYGAMEMDWGGRGMDRRGNGMLVAGDVANNAWN
jgi:hypothetical protein